MGIKIYHKYDDTLKTPPANVSFLFLENTLIPVYCYIHMFSFCHALAVISHDLDLTSSNCLYYCIIIYIFIDNCR